MLTGIDISGYQAGIPQSVINQADVVVVKATEGVGYVNPEMVTQFTQGVNGGKKVGVYHFARPGDATAQAEYFVNTVQGSSLYPDFYVLDFEDSSLLANEGFALEFLGRVSELTETTPWFYCYMSPMKTYGYSGVRAAGYKLWLAGYPYGTQYGFGPQMSLDDYIDFSGWGDSAGWDVAGWQYSSQGRLDGWGADLDFNIFFEDVVNNHTGVLPGQEEVPDDEPPAMMEKAIAWMSALQGRVTYSMTDRNGPSSYDCSSAVYHALISAGIMSSDSRIGNTETMFNDLPAVGFRQLEVDVDGTYHARRGDVFIWGRQGESAGSGGHTGIFVDADNIIHCNFGYNGITINNHNAIWNANGRMTVAIYRYEGLAQTQAQREEQELADLLEQKRPELNNRSVIEVVREIDKNTWSSKRMIRVLFDMFRIGIPGVVTDGALGPTVRKLLSYDEKRDGQARLELWKKGANNNFEF